MNLLFTGRGTSGSWQVRGVQLGQACHASVITNATDFTGIDKAVVVKRITPESLQALRKADIPWAWDILDCYPQPLSNTWIDLEAIAWVRKRITDLSPTGIIWPTRQMRDDCDTGLPSLVLYHHYRPGIAINPIRKTVARVGYEGAAAYISAVRSGIEAICRKRGWAFVEASPGDVDICIALRSGSYRSYVTTHWKSNIKLANAHGSGTPFVGQQECGYLETASGAEYWTDGAPGLDVCFRWLESQSTREQISDRFRQKAYSVEQAAQDLTRWLGGL